MQYIAKQNGSYMKHLAINLETWNGKIYQDITEIAGILHISRATLRRKLKQNGKLFMNQYFITDIEEEKSARGGRNEGSIKKGQVIREPKNNHTGSTIYTDTEQDYT